MMSKPFGQLVGSGEERTAAWIERGWVGLMVGGGNGQHFADRIDQQAEAAGGAFEDQDDVAAFLAGFEPEF